jgi:AmmeMemoRadiSam system protein A
MPVLSAFIVPHPPLLIPEVGGERREAVRQTIDAYEEISRRIRDLNPETLVFISPHAISYSDYFHISPGTGGRGTMAQFGAPNVTFEASYDSELIEEISRLAGEQEIPAGTLGEKDKKMDHGVTVPLYFIAQQLKHYSIVRISISGLGFDEHYKFGRCLKEAIEKTNRNVVIIASGDLSHRLTSDGPYTYAREGPEFDKEITQAMAQADFLKFITLDESFCDQAGECGLRSFIIMAGALDKTSVAADMLSYEGPFGVGYAICAYKPIAPDENRDFLKRFRNMHESKLEEIKSKEDPFVNLARQSLEHYVRTGKTMRTPTDLPPELSKVRAGVFVTLKKAGRLRGCIGTIQPVEKSIAEEIIKNAVTSGVGDLRFQVVTKDELDELVYSVDVLSPSEPITDKTQLDVKKYGVIVSSGGKRGLLLPNLDNVQTVGEQISIALQKAGISENANYNMERFEVVRHH